MDLNVENCLIKLLLLCLCLTSAFTRNVPNLAPLVPHIDQQYYQLIPEKNGYRLSLILPNGSMREEFVEVKHNENDGTTELTVTGSYEIKFTDVNKKAEVIYKADKNGYRLIQYNYSGEIAPPKPEIQYHPQSHIEVSAVALKSTGG